MNISEVRITLRNEDKLKAFASVTFDDEFVVRGLKVISGKQGYFVSMPSRKRPDGTYQDVAHPINNEMRRKIEEQVLDAYETELNKNPEERQEEASGEEQQAVTEEPTREEPAEEAAS